MATATTKTLTTQEDDPSLVSVADVVAAIEDLLGPSLSARIAGIEELTTIAVWASGHDQPGNEIVQRLRTALGIADLLLAVERPSVVRAWFGGQNRMLGDRPPALVLGTDPEAVWRAARAFRAYG